jgi:hypothetical protein
MSLVNVAVYPFKTTWSIDPFNAAKVVLVVSVELEVVLAMEVACLVCQ